MSFQLVATATSIAAFLLGIGWMFAGRLLLRRWRMEPHDDGLVVGRRIGVVYFGISILLFLGRSAPPSELRTAISIGVLIALVMLAVLGIFEFASKRTGPAILVSVALEVVLSAGFVWVLATGAG